MSKINYHISYRQFIHYALYIQYISDDVIKLTASICHLYVIYTTFSRNYVIVAERRSFKSRDASAITTVKP